MKAIGKRIIAVGAIVIALGISACARDEEGSGVRGDVSQTDGSPSAPSSSPSDSLGGVGSGTEMPTASVKVIDTDFRVGTLTVSAGTKVVWTQVGDQPHSVSANDKSFDSSPGCSPIRSDECLGEGDIFKHEFVEPGTYEYYCRVHGLPDGTGMVGTVIVE